MQWLIGGVGVVSLALLVAWLAGTISPPLPSPVRAWFALENSWRDNPLRPEDGFRLVLFWLENDANGVDTRDVELALSDVEGITLVRSARIVAGFGASSDCRRTIQQSVQEVLENRNADLAIVGRVKEPRSSLSLWFVPRSDEDRVENRIPRNQPYKLERVTLGADFHADLRHLLTVTALTAVGPLAKTETRGQVLEQGLRDATKKLSTLLDSHTIIRDEHRAALSLALGNALQTLGERERDTGSLEGAVKAYRTALEVHTREKDPPKWAAIQNDLGTALQSLGERDGAMARLEEAVASYRVVLQVYTREKEPLDWAMTQNNLGNTLSIQGRLEHDTERLKEAVKAYRAVLGEYTREKEPLDWAMTQNNLGNAFQTLGELEMDAGRLKEAVEAYRAALKERTHERVPLDWAKTQLNLGNALRLLGEPERGTGRLEEAVKAFRAALQELTRERMPLDWAKAQLNLGIALAVLGEPERGTGRLEEAVKAFRAALQELTRERMPLDWAGAQFNLGNALLLLGEHERGTGRLKEAVEAYRAALQMFTAEEDPKFHKLVTKSLERGFSMLRARQGGFESVEEPK